MKPAPPVTKIMADYVSAPREPSLNAAARLVVHCSPSAAKEIRMATRSDSKDPDEGAGAAQFADIVKESAQQIWLAGLGAFSKAQQEGGKVFEALVKEGVGLQKKTQAAAEEKLTEATSRMAGMAKDLSSQAGGQWDKLEGIFEQRVRRALKNLGVPAAGEIQALEARVQELERQLAATHAGARRGARTAGRTAGRTESPAPAKTARKRAPRKAAG
jgi:poly(hydroxyalkanoate) granule-associated protein